MKLPLLLPLLFTVVCGVSSFGQVEKARPSGGSVTTPPQAQTAAAVPQGAEVVNPPLVTIDLQKLFDTDPKAKDGKDKLDAERNAAKKELDDRMDKRKRLYDEIKKFDTTLAKAKQAITAKEQTQWMRGAKSTALKALDDQIREFQATREKGLQDSATRLQNQVVDDIHKAAAAAPSLDGVAFLLDRNGSTMNGLPFVVYAAPDLDRNGAVQKQMGAANADDAPNAPAGPRPNVATVDMKKIFASYYKTKEAETEITAARAAAKLDIDTRMATFTELGKTLKALEDELAGPTLVGAPRKAKSTERSAKATEVKDMEREITDLESSNERKFQEASTRLRTAIVDDINRVIMEGVKAEGHTGLIFDASGPSLSGIPVLLRLEGVPDWTESVITTLNNSKPGAKSAPAGPAVSSVPAGGLKYAVVDMKRIFAAAPSTKAADKALNDARAQAKPGSASDADAKAKEKEFENAAIKKHREVLEKMNKLLTERAAKAGHQVVFDSSANSASGAPLVLIRDGAPDLSDEMIAALREAKP